MAFITATFDETKPAGTRAPTLGDDDIREFKSQIRERLSVDHDHRADEAGAEETTTPTGTIGYHKKVTLTERAANPTNVANAGILYTKDDGGDTELYWEDDGGTVKQLTKDGALNVSAAELAAIGADVDFGAYEVRAQTFESDVATGTAPFTIASTTVSTNLNADLLDGKHDGEVTPANASVTAAKATALLGAYVDKSGGYGAQVAATDGFVSAYADVGNSGTIAFFTDINANPTTRVDYATGGAGVNGETCNVDGFVRKGDSWKVVISAGTATVYWIPLGS